MVGCWTAWWLGQLDGKKDGRGASFLFCNSLFGESYGSSTDKKELESRFISFARLNKIRSACPNGHETWEVSIIAAINSA